MVGDGVISDYSIGGAVAAIYYSEPMDTADLDIFVVLPQNSLIVTMTPIFEYLKREGYSDFVKEGVVVGGVPVQFLPVTPGLSTDAHANALSAEYEGVPMRVVGLEHLMATMLQVGRPKDISRLLNFVSRGEYDSAKFNGILEKHGLASKWENFRDKFEVTDGPVAS